MKLFKIFIQAACVIALAFAAHAYAQTTPATLHAFTGQTEETDSYPYARLILYKGVFYGTTYGNGANSEGTVFKVNLNGSGFTVLYTFTGISDGANPQAGLLLSNGILYGTTSSGGSGGSGEGTVFEVGTNGKNFKVLYTFTGGSDGGVPLAGLVLSNNMLYGTTAEGGSGYGTVFTVGTNGKNFAVLHPFTGGNDGAGPQADLVLSGSTLYGTTAEGGNGYGTVFSVTTSGAFNPIYAFSAETFNGSAYVNNDGAYPLAGLVLSGGTLYGTAAGGGAYGQGTMFSFNLSNGAFATLWNFAGASDGGNPLAGLVYSGGTLYGTTSVGGDSLNGTVFSFNLSNPGVITLHSFDVSDGSGPAAALTLSGGTLYGTTPYDGSGKNVFGTLFKIDTNGLHFGTVCNFVATTFTDGLTPHAGLVKSGNILYGTTQAGGNGHGTVYQVTIDGTLYKTIYSFTGGADGAAPSGRLILSGSTLYGTAEGGGIGYGTVFKVNTDGSGFVPLFTFHYSDGSAPNGDLVLSTDGSTLYGTTSDGTTAQAGTVFSLNIKSKSLTTLWPFTGGNDGGKPQAGLVLSGSTLYGTTEVGGSGGEGTLFSLNINTKNIPPNTLWSFSGVKDGGAPAGDLVLSGNMLYGTTSDGGGPTGDAYGTAFSFNLNIKNSLNTLWFFTDGLDGGTPFQGLVLSGSTLYGTTTEGGTTGLTGFGTVFSLNINGGMPTTLCSFTGGYDGAIPNGQLILSGGLLYGTAQSGGFGSGTVFSLPDQ